MLVKLAFGDLKVDLVKAPEERGAKFDKMHCALCKDMYELTCAINLKFEPNLNFTTWTPHFGLPIYPIAEVTGHCMNDPRTTPL